MPEEVTPVVQLCPACEDEQSSAKALVLKVTGIGAALTPILLLMLKYFAALHNTPFALDDKLTYAVLAAYAALMACMFKLR